MRLLIYDSSPQVREGFMISLLSAGYDLMVIKDKRELLLALSKKPFSLAIIEVEETDVEMLQLIKILRTDPKYEFLKVIVHVLNPSKQFVIDMLKLGVVGYLLKPFSEKEIVNRLKNILEKANIDMPQRLHVRVKPLDSEPISVAFRSPITHKVISGKVSDISIGGVAFVLNSSVDENEIQIKQIINNLQIQIGSIRISISALVTAKKGNVCALLFHKISDFDLNVLCKYIYERLTDGVLPK